MEPYEPTLNAIGPELSFGATTIHIYRSSELQSGQVGYSVNPEGRSLVGEQAADWRGTWLVIGYDDTSGDPIFIDTAEEGYPVYTAMTGQGGWCPKRIATSLLAFGQVLSAIGAVAKGREHPVALERNPLNYADREATLATIRRLTPQTGLEFWEDLLTES